MYYIIKPIATMTSRALKRRWLRTKIALNQTVQKILDINKRRKMLTVVENAWAYEEQLQEELRVLNRTADQQARMLRRYELELSVQLQSRA